MGRGTIPSDPGWRVWNENTQNEPRKFTERIHYRSALLGSASLSLSKYRRKKRLDASGSLERRWGRLDSLFAGFGDGSRANPFQLFVCGLLANRFSNQNREIPVGEASPIGQT
jgi:hypothetical protein